MSTEIITTEKMAFGGDCIAKINGKTVFVPYSIPGEKLEVEIIKDTRDYSVARIVSIIEPSLHRVIPFCKFYGKCGGCNMQHIDTDYQTELRSQIIKDTFEKEGVEVPQTEVIKGSAKNYRSRFQFHSGGLMEKQTNNVIPLDCCPCATEEINHYLKEVPVEQRPAGRVHVFASNKITSIPEGFDKIIIAEEQAVQKRKPEKKMPERTSNGRKLPKQKKIKPRFTGTTVNPANICTVNLLEKNITFDVQGFFQSNLEVLEKTIPVITQGITGNVLDMYAGAGTFSVFLADKAQNLCLVEHNRDALVYAEQNLVGKIHESYGLSGDTWVKYHAESYINRNGNFDAVVIDPPRTGMEKSVCQWLCSSQIPQIKSLSCDIATHARDAKFLIRSGYKLEKLFLLDFYPQTCHVESLAWFTK